MTTFATENMGAVVIDGPVMTQRPDVVDVVVVSTCLHIHHSPAYSVY